jgi:NADH:ubiquinone oxidoreductase subunit 4 (subunit M)
MLRAYRITFMGSVREQWQKLPDLNPVLRLPVTLLVAALLWVGFCPQFFVRSVAPTFGTFLSTNSNTQTCSEIAMRRLQTVKPGREHAPQKRGYSMR